MPYCPRRPTSTIVQQPATHSEPQLPPLAWLLAPFAFGYFCSYFFRNINAVVGPLLASEFALGPRELGLLTSTYFLSFAAAQIPVGMALDRFGPSRVCGALLLIISAGATAFALSHGMSALIMGRALLGLGAAGMLMSGLSAVPMWTPKAQVATFMGYVTAVGGTGAIAAATPVQLAVEAIGWRNTFFVGAAFAATIGVGALATARWSQPKAAGQSLAQLMQGVRTIYTNRRFWQLGIAPAILLGTFLSFQSLWAATWLRDVAGMERIAVGNVLMALNVSMVVGFFTCGLISDRLVARGWAPITPVKLMVTLGLAAQLLIIVAPQGAPYLSWALYSYSANSMLLMFPIVGREFAPELAGRVNTCLNLACFVTAFVTQWLIGAILNLYPVSDGHYHASGYYAAWLALLAIQVVLMVRMHLATRSMPQTARET